jgi:hypothetical protein
VDIRIAGQLLTRTRDGGCDAPMMMLHEDGYSRVQVRDERRLRERPLREEEKGGGKKASTTEKARRTGDDKPARRHASGPTAGRNLFSRISANRAKSEESRLYIHASEARCRCHRSLKVRYNFVSYLTFKIKTKNRGLGLAIASILLASADAAVVAINRSRTTQLDQLASAHGSALRIIQCSASVRFLILPRANFDSSYVPSN